MQQRELRARAGLAVGDARAICVVVKPKLHPIRLPATRPRSKAERRWQRRPAHAHALLEPAQELGLNPVGVGGALARRADQEAELRCRGLARVDAAGELAGDVAV